MANFEIKTIEVEDDALKVKENLMSLGKQIPISFQKSSAQLEGFIFLWKHSVHYLVSTFIYAL